MTVAYLVQNPDKRIVLLSIDLLQLNGDIVNLLQSLRAEEVGRVVVRLQHLLVLWRHNGCQLSQVANHQQLNTAKRLMMVAKAS